MKCAECGAPCRQRDDEPIADMKWCNSECSKAWYAARPEEAAKWTKVEDLTAEQRAVVDATLGVHKGQA
jgi:hypothetical protein